MNVYVCMNRLLHGRSTLGKLRVDENTAKKIEMVGGCVKSWPNDLEQFFKNG